MRWTSLWQSASPVIQAYCSIKISRLIEKAKKNKPIDNWEKH